MALFKRTTKKKEGAAADVTPSVIARVSSDLAHILRRPRITEKATIQQGMSVYVFDVDSKATKQEIKHAVERYYKVRPRLVRIVNLPDKSVRNMRTGQRGRTAGAKKAYVYLSKGASITIA